jgi:hypothetical protein
MIRVTLTKSQFATLNYCNSGYGSTIEQPHPRIILILHALLDDTKIVHIGPIEKSPL